VRAREFLPACFLVFTALLVWPLLTIANRPALVAGAEGPEGSGETNQGARDHRGGP
jgi:hypothetical protein